MRKETKQSNVKYASLEPKQQKLRIINQINQYIKRYDAEPGIKITLRKLSRQIEESSLKNPLFDFPSLLDQYNQLTNNLKNSLKRFVNMEQEALGMEAVKSEHINADEVLGYIQEGERHAEKAKDLDLVIFVGNTGAGKSTMINALHGCKMVWGRYFKDNNRPNDEGWLEYEEQSLFDLPEIRKLSVEKIQILKSRLLGWVEPHDSIDSFMKILRGYGVNVNAEVRTLTEKTIKQQKNVQSQKNQANYLRRVLLVDNRHQGNVKEMAPIGHSMKSCTFYPKVLPSAKMNYVDCPGLIDNRTKEIEIANSVNTMHTITKARNVKVVILLNYNSLKADRARGLVELWGIIENLFGNKENVVKHHDSILINISHVPEVAEGLPNHLAGLRNVLGEKSELMPLLDQVVVCDPLDRTLAEGVISLNEFSNKIRSLKNIENPDQVFQTAMSAATGKALLLFANEAKDDVLQDLNQNEYQKSYRKLHYLMQLAVLKFAPLNQKIEEIKKRIQQQLTLLTDKIHIEKDLPALEVLADQIYLGLLLDHVVGSNQMKEAYFKAKLSVFKLLIKEPVLEMNKMHQLIQNIYWLINHYNLSEWTAMIRSLIDDLFHKGSYLAITPYTERLAKKLFVELNAQLVGSHDQRHGILAQREFDEIAKIGDGQPTAEEMFDALVEAKWLSRLPDNEEEAKIELANLVNLDDQESLRSDLKLPQCFEELKEHKKLKVKKAIFDLFKKSIDGLLANRRFIRKFLTRKCLEFNKSKNKREWEVIDDIFFVAETKEEEQPRNYRLHQILLLVKTYFNRKKAERYLECLNYLRVLDFDLASKRYELLSKIIDSFQVMNQILFTQLSYVPVGSVHMIPSRNIPTGFKECNGDWLPVHLYTALYHVLQNTFGERKQGSERQFKLPDYRGYFLRGMRRDRAFSNEEKDTTRLPRNKNFKTSTDGNHNHSGNTSSSGSHTHNTFNMDGVANRIRLYHNDSWLYYHYERRGADKTSTAGSHSHSLDINTSGNHSHTVNSGGDDETRPQNYPVTYMIKY